MKRPALSGAPAAAIVMLAGAVLGGFAGANLGRYIGQSKARAAVIVIGNVSIPVAVLAGVIES